MKLDQKIAQLSVARRSVSLQRWLIVMGLSLVGLGVLGCGSAKAPAESFEIGDRAERDGWALQVHGLWLLEGQASRYPEAGHAFCAVELTLSNRSTGIRYVMPERQLQLQDAAGRQYALHHPAGVVAARARGWMVPEGEMQPGQEVRGAVSYQIPLDAGELTLVFRTSLLPWAGTVAFDLGSPLD